MDVLSRCNRTRINCLIACLLLVGILGAGQLTGAEEFDVVEDGPETSAPYIVFVAEESGFLRSGPGKEHYRTDSLRRGQELEVYVETATEWLGVRPPDESFCWMPADAVDRTDGEELGTIKEDKTVAWIGTHLGKARRYRWQVQLNAGEQVTIIGETERQDADGSKTWLRIVPPSGEFRWIHRDQVVESAEQLAESVAEAVAAGNDSPMSKSQLFRSWFPSTAMILIRATIKIGTAARASCRTGDWEPQVTHNRAFPQHLRADR